MRKDLIKYIGILAVVLFASSCQDDEYTVPEASSHFQNDAIKRSFGPNVAGLEIEFVYAMALGCDQGNIVSAQVEASIPGAEGTYLEHHSYHTGSGGADVGVVVGNPSTTTGNVTTVDFTVDTCAASLRYYYIVPEEAKGQTVSFTFSAVASTGEEVKYDLGPYKVGKVDVKRDIVLSNNNFSYFSIADLEVYDAEQVAPNPDKIDLVYLYRPIDGINFNHALVAPTADSEFLPEVTLPGPAENATKIRQTWQLHDEHLERKQYSVFIDDLDFKELDLSQSADYAINLRAESGAWVETVDGLYRAFIYVNEVNNSEGTMTISVKRYTVE